MVGESLPYRVAVARPDGDAPADADIIGPVWAPSLAAALPHLVAAIPADAVAVTVAVDQAELDRVAEAQRAREAADEQPAADELE